MSVLYSGITNQLILFSKGWYKRTDNVMDDLATLMSGITDAPKSMFNQVELYRDVINAFVECCNKQDCANVLFETLVYRDGIVNIRTASITEIIYSMIGKMACIKILGNHNEVLVELPEPNPEYMALASEVK